MLIAAHVHHLLTCVSIRFDCRMPVLDGLWLLAHVVGDQALADVGVVMLTILRLDEYVLGS